MKHELECASCAALDSWRKHNEKCRTCITGLRECARGTSLREAHQNACREMTRSPLEREAGQQERTMLARRRELGLTLVELADRCADAGCPVTFGQISRLERGLITNPRKRTRDVLARLLDLDPLDIGKVPAGGAS